MILPEVLKVVRSIGIELWLGLRTKHDTCAAAVKCIGSASDREAWRGSGEDAVVRRQVFVTRLFDARVLLTVTSLKKALWPCREKADVAEHVGGDEVATCAYGVEVRGLALDVCRGGPHG